MPYLHDPAPYPLQQCPDKHHPALITGALPHQASCMHGMALPPRTQVAETSLPSEVTLFNSSGKRHVAESKNESCLIISLYISLNW